jgi:hypothetical protein
MLVWVSIQRSNSVMRWIGSGSALAFSRSPLENTTNESTPPKRLAISSVPTLNS